MKIPQILFYLFQTNAGADGWMMDGNVCTCGGSCDDRGDARHLRPAETFAGS